MEVKYDIMADFNSDKYEGVYCEKVNCTMCDGVSYDGEPNGYGCPGNDAYIEKRYRSILKRRMNILNRNTLMEK